MTQEVIWDHAVKQRFPNWVAAVLVALTTVLYVNTHDVSMVTDQ